MRGNRYSTVEVSETGKLEWNHLLLTWPKKRREWRKSFVIFMFVANNSILSRLFHIFFSQVNRIEGVLPDDEV